MKSILYKNLEFLHKNSISFIQVSGVTVTLCGAAFASSRLEYSCISVPSFLSFPPSASLAFLSNSFLLSSCQYYILLPHYMSCLRANRRESSLNLCSVFQIEPSSLSHPSSRSYVHARLVPKVSLLNTVIACRNDA